ncbi:MAG: tRNA uridine(34) 5-carboxymethylaminomethyl modification radical SAM/GNAT enzyme Elp3, partial [Candidatus Magasanikbacteria bacterium]
MKYTDEQLQNVVTEIFSQSPKSKKELNRIRLRTCSKMRISQPSNPLLFQVYQNLLKKGKVEKNKQVEILLRKADIRSTSGISVITSLVKPYACPGQCVYCPTEARMPKSYMENEPAAARALRLCFDPYEQMIRRIQMLQANGHETDKVEFIIKGGTWNAYPLKYQYWFILESFKACNDLKRRKPIGPMEEKEWKDKTVEDLQKELMKEQKYNESAHHRIIGLTLETRPDAITPNSIYHMRLLGCTRIELGLQAPDDSILQLIKRGHTVQQFKDAMYLLREAGFKVDLHFMPDLPGTTPEHDVEMYKMLFSDPGFKPDMVKIYPNTVIKSSELYQWFLEGKFKPYGDKQLFEALLQMKLATPRYCRISRLIRDIPEPDIQAGNAITNLREELHKEMKKPNKTCVCLRCREISRQKENIPEDTLPQIFVDEYDTLGGKEFFITFEDPKRIAVFGFLRLRIPTEKTNTKLLELIPEIKDCAFVRELHVYGTLVEIGKTNTKASQHKGYGKRLMAEAEKIAKQYKTKKLAV